MKNLLWDIRLWLIKRLAGKARIAINLIIDGSLNGDVSDRSLTDGCAFVNRGLDPIAAEIQKNIKRLSKVALESARTRQPETR